MLVLPVFAFFAPSRFKDSRLHLRLDHLVHVARHEVVAESDEPRYRRSAPLYAALATVPAEADVVVYTPLEVAEWSAVPQAFVTTAIREGRVLYEGTI